MKAIEKVIENIEKARLKVSPHHIVKLVAVSKSVEAQSIEALYKEGQRAFGENKVQDMTRKANTLSTLPLEWHFIGRLQTNKINALLALSPSLIHSVDSLSLAHALNARAKREGKRVNILLQINAACEESKAGVHPDEAKEVYGRIIEECSELSLQGVMTIGAHSDDEIIIRKSFITTRLIFDELSRFNPTVCSMGMSGDYALAIECGSTMIRVGSALFDDTRYK